MGINKVTLTWNPATKGHLVTHILAAVLHTLRALYYEKVNDIWDKTCEIRIYIYNSDKKGQKQWIMSEVTVPEIFPEVLAFGVDSDLAKWKKAQVFVIFHIPPNDEKGP